MAQICPAKSTIVPFKKQMYSSGSIILSYKDDKCICVSIHAPTRGATLQVFKKSYLSQVSIHAPTRGATSLLLLLYFVILSFNPRTHEGCDSLAGKINEEELMFQSTHPRGVRPSWVTGLDSHYFVSIHAPTRGATVPYVFYKEYQKFQSTHPRGVRRTNTDICHISTMFQSTHPRGVRLALLNNVSNIVLFQSTHPRGVRRKYMYRLRQFIRFNPRTHEGCDRSSQKDFGTLLKFQSTHPRGVRLYGTCRACSTKNVSIHAPTRGATAHTEMEFSKEILFQSTHPRGVRPW